MIYEILTIVPANFADTEVDGIATGIAKMLENDGLKVERTENLGKLKLAYPIDHARYGTYVLFFASTDKVEIMKKVDQNLRLSEEVLRHMIVTCPAGIPARIPRPGSYVPPLNAEGRRSSEKEKSDERAPKAGAKATAADEKLSTKELDKKLDEILDSDIMKSI